MQSLYSQLTDAEMLRLRRKRKRMNLLVLGALVLFVGATFAGSVLHNVKETEAAAAHPTPTSITQP